MAAQSLRGDLSSEELSAGLRVFVRTIDPYGDYIRPEVLLSMELIRSGSYTGVGLDVIWNRDGRFVCLPMPGGPAMEAGVTYGQELLAVAGHEARILGIEDIGYLLRGDPGTTVELKVWDPTGGSARTLNLRRRTLQSSSVARVDMGFLPGVRIFKFTEQTPQELTAALRDVDLSKGLVVDLRGNTGGDFQAAVKAAGLFLEEGAVVCTQRNRTGDKVFRSSKKLLRPRKIYLWQDQLTASAAEVFLAAIVDNRQGIGIGLTSFGKGVSQKLFNLSHGGAVLLSNAELLTPSGRKYDGVGIAPAYQVPRAGAWSDSEYWDMTRNILHEREELGPGGGSPSWWRKTLSSFE
jgi:carboxyl-terminal processing protease